MLLPACGVQTQGVRLQLDPIVEGTPQPRTLIRAVPIRTSATPLPVSLESLSQAIEAGGDAGYTDERGRVTLRLMPGHPHLLVVSPLPFGLPADQATAPPVWNWRLEADLVTLSRWHTEAVGTDAASATADGPELRIQR